MSLSEQNRALDSRARVEIDMESGLPQVRIVSEQTWITWSPSVSAFGVDIPVEQLVQQAKAFVAGLSPLAPRAEGATTAEGRQTAKRCRHGFPLADDEDGCIKCGEEDRAARAEGVAALQQAGEPEKNDALRAIMPFAEIGAASEIARFNAMHLPDDHSIAAYIGIDRVRAAMSAARDALAPLPQQTALVEGQSPELDDINGRLA